MSGGPSLLHAAFSCDALSRPPIGPQPVAAARGPPCEYNFDTVVRRGSQRKIAAPSKGECCTAWHGQTGLQHRTRAVPKGGNCGPRHKWGSIHLPALPAQTWARHLPTELAANRQHRVSIQQCKPRGQQQVAQGLAHDVISH